MSELLYSCTTWNLIKRFEKKLNGDYTRMQSTVRTNPVSSSPQNSSCTATYLPFHKQSKKDEQDMSGTAGEAETNS